MQVQINRIIPSLDVKTLAKASELLAVRGAASTPVLFEWGVAMFAVGIGLYFALPFEPVLSVIFAICALSLCICVFASRNDWSGRVPALFIMLALFGLGRAAWHSDAASSPKLPNFERAYYVTGWVSAVEASGNRTRWQIHVTEIEGLKPEQTPKLIRTSSAGQGVQAGDFIRIRSVLSAPPGPVVPGGYDPARQAYFRGIGGYGYAISKAEKVDPVQIPFNQSFLRDLVKVRYGLAQRILAASPETTAGLQVGLLTGIRTFIPPEQTEVLRIAGLAHILAISGLHMAAVAGSIYTLTSLLLACCVPLARRYDIRKPAAIIGALAATAYLLMSGASVATQRAYIMAIIVFLAIILDRRAFSMRSVALAAVITLAAHPEALVSAGFQMSFSAVAALVAVYRAWDARRVYSPAGRAAKMGQAMTSLSVTSFVAGFATSGFAMLHFNRMATFGLAGNLLAMPIFTFWVMPAAIAVFPAFLIGAEHIPLWVMGKGLELVLELAGWVANWPGAVAHIAAAPGWVVGLYGLAFCALCLGPLILRMVATPVIIGCIGVWYVTPHPDMRISQEGAVAFWDETGETRLYVDRKRADRYGREQFVKRAGVSGPVVDVFSKSAAICDALACRVSIKGRTVSITDYPSEVATECQSADVVILTQRNAGPVARRHCQADLIDGRVLRAEGAQDLYFKGHAIGRVSALTASRKRRPWGRQD